MIYVIYLDNGATTWPKPPSVLREIRRLTNHDVDIDQIDEWFDLRKKIKRKQKSKG